MEDLSRGAVILPDVTGNASTKGVCEHGPGLTGPVRIYLDNSPGSDKFSMRAAAPGAGILVRWGGHWEGEAKVQTRGLSVVLVGPLADAISLTMSSFLVAKHSAFDYAKSPETQKVSLEKWVAWAKAYAPEAK